MYLLHMSSLFFFSGALATYRSIPIITGLGDVIKDRQRYKTLIRLSHDGRFVANAILAFLRHFQWKKFGVIFRLGDPWYTTVSNGWILPAVLRLAISCFAIYGLVYEYRL